MNDLEVRRLDELSDKAVSENLSQEELDELYVLLLEWSNHANNRKYALSKDKMEFRNSFIH